MVYKWKDLAKLNGVKVDAQVAGEHLEELRQVNTRLTPDIVVEDAKDEKSPLHDEFEWDDSIAAGAYRIDQAKFLLRHILVVTVNAPEVRAFVSVKLEDDKTFSYTSVEHAMAVPELRSQVLARAQAEVIMWRERYDHLHEFARIYHAIDVTVKG